MEVNILLNIQKRNEEKARELAEKFEAMIREREERHQKMEEEMFSKINKVTKDHW